MALEKSIATSIGVPATYWKITFHGVTFPTPAQGQHSGCTLHGWPDADSRQQFAPIDTRLFNWTGDSVPMTRDEAYAEIKQDPEFAGAADV